MQQGFNRSFCGKHANFFGKGVYFARDASYSTYPLYCEPDAKGSQTVFLVRVVTGEFCKGIKNALTPDLRNAAKNQLYDSTVDNVRDPSIFVTYHDAQAYPEYMRDPASTIDAARLTVSTRAGSNSHRRNHPSPTSTRPRINRPTASTGATSSWTSTSPFSFLKTNLRITRRSAG